MSGRKRARKESCGLWCHCVDPLEARGLKVDCMSLTAASGVRPKNTGHTGRKLLSEPEAAALEAVGLKLESVGRAALVGLSDS